MMLDKRWVAFMIKKNLSKVVDCVPFVQQFIVLVEN